MWLGTPIGELVSMLPISFSYDYFFKFELLLVLNPIILTWEIFNFGFKSIFEDYGPSVSISLLGVVNNGWVLLADMNFIDNLFSRGECLKCNSECSFYIYNTFLHIV